MCFAQTIVFCAVAPEAARATRLHDLRRLLNGVNILLGYSPPLPSGFFRRELGFFAVAMTSRIGVTLV